MLEEQGKTRDETPRPDVNDPPADARANPGPPVEPFTECHQQRQTCECQAEGLQIRKKNRPKLLHQYRNELTPRKLAGNLESVHDSRTANGTTGVMPPRCPARSATE